MVVVLYLYMWAVNKKRDREAAVSSSGLTVEQEKEAIERGMQVRTYYCALGSISLFSDRSLPRNAREWRMKVMNMLARLSFLHPTTSA